MRTWGRSATGRTGPGYQLLAAASALLCGAGLALAGQPSATAATAAHALAAVNRAAVSHHPGHAKAHVSAVRSSTSKVARAPLHRAAKAKGTSSFRLPADVKAVCPTPANGRVACLSLVRTNVKAHKGRFAPDASPPGYGPSDLQSAYNLPSASAGSGATVAVVDAGDDPTAESDLATYRAQYGLPTCTTANGCFEKVNQEGQQGSYPPEICNLVDGCWPEEESLDLDMISAICPNCHILLVEANSIQATDLGASVNEAVTLGAEYVSNSYGLSESSSETSLDQYYNHPGVVITASAGDSGYGVEYPATSRYVTAVGGTTLTRDTSTARGWSESAWDGTGSGCSAYEAKPGWQTDTGCAKRTVADVSADANPVTGVAFYDTSGGSGWGVIGGTSVASPVIAATYALAGAPLAGTYPASYPYLNASGHLNDVTTGANGTCTPAYLCTAGPGYDGPTGLGTPDGTSAFTPAASGTLSGTVTDATTGRPIADATVTAGHVSTITTSSGSYTLALAPGSYKVTGAAYGHVAQAATVQVTIGQASTQNFTLQTSAGMVTVSGKVTDGSGHGWPLYARITVPGTPLQAVYTNPANGQYTLRVPADGSYTLDAAPVSPGYTSASDTVKVSNSDLTKNIKPLVNTSTCTAPGYPAKYDGAGTEFTGWTGHKPKDGWTVTANSGGNGDTWLFGNDPTNEEGQGNGNPAPPGSSGGYAIADSLYNHPGTLDTSLVSPVVNLSAVSSPQISFDSWYYVYGTGRGQSAEVDLSLDGGQTWTSVWQQTAGSQEGSATIPIPQAAGQSDVQVRFTYTGSDDWWWSLDNIVIGTQSCAPAPGGLVVGTVTDANTGQPVNGATITEKSHPQGTTVSAATGDPAIPGGFYEMFSPPGTHSLTAVATKAGYTDATATVDVARNTVTQWNWKLTAGHLVITPATASVTEPLGASRTVHVSLADNGAQPVQVSLGAQDGGFTPTGGSRGSGLMPAAKSSKLRIGAGVSPWTKIARYPIAVWGNAVATDPQTHDVYSVGGYLVGNAAPTNKAYRYSPGTGRWTPIAPAPTPLGGAYAAFIDGTLYLAGGKGGASNLDYLSAVYAYSPTLNAWSQVASLPDSLAGGAGAVLDGDLYVIGGCDAATGPCGLSDGTGSQAAYRFDQQAGRWVKIARYPVPVHAEACAGIDGQVVCTGGESIASNGNVGTTGTYLYDPASNAWRQGADLPFPNYGMAYAGAGGDLQVAGGVELDSSGATIKAPAAEYDPAANTWSTLPKPLHNVFGSGSSCGLYQIGGYNIKGVLTQDAEVLAGYDQCDGAGALGWLSQSHDSLTINPGQSVTVSVRMDSSAVSQPGSYQATLYASTNTPYPPQLVGLTLNVKPAQGMREVSGTVTAAGGHALAGASVAITAAGQATTAVQANATGHYQWWMPGGSGAVQVSAAKDGYQPQAVTTGPTPGAPAVTNFTLKPDPSQLPYTGTGTAARQASVRHGGTLAAAVHGGAAPQDSSRGASRASRAVRGRPAQPRRSSPAQPADVKAVCPTPARGHAACMSLVRTNVTPHRGRFGPDQAPAGYGPSDLQSAYNLPSATAGSGETVAVVDAGDDPTAEADLATYRAQYGLPACTTANGCFEKVNQEGQQSNYPPEICNQTDGCWPEEESLDLDMVSAVCPSCHIILVEANTSNIPDLGASVDEAVTLGATFVSNSYGSTGAEQPSETSWDQYYNHPGVVITASAGDSGYGVHYPAVSPYVTSVGGTTLTRDPGTARGWTESVWENSGGLEGTGSGCSLYEAKPAWQTDTGCNMRTDNDVAAVADPNTGVAVYDTTTDTGAGGWLVAGGTSAASPIIAATYALAGAPESGDYPASYLYKNPSALNDVTSGSNGTCTPAYLCTAGPGYDGPTGLGTPDGTAAFTAPSEEGTLTGTVTSGGQPLTGVTVTVDGMTLTTSSTGQYSVALLPGTYAVMASDFGYGTRTASNVQVTVGQTTTQNFALAKAKMVTVSGTVSDGSGHKWPLYAKITALGTPLAPVYTNPATGQYSISVPGKATYNLDVTPTYTGYTPATVTVHVGSTDVTRNIKITVDPIACDAPGYKIKYDGAGEQFTGWTGTTPKDGWTVTDNNNSGYGWEFDNASGDGNQTGSSGGFAEAETDTLPGTTESTSLTSPVVNLSHNSAPQISFEEYSLYISSFGGQYTGEVDLSLDGGTTWQTVRGPVSEIGQNLVTIPIPQAAGQSDVKVRFTFTGSGPALWQVDNIVIGTAACKAAIHGGLVTGQVTDANTGAPVDGATVTVSAKHGGTATSAETGDPAIPGGFYWLFSPAGQQSLTATGPGSGYAQAAASVDVTSNTVTRQDWALQAGQLAVTPATSLMTETLGQHKMVKLTYTNNGSSALQVSLGAQDGGYTPATSITAGVKADSATAGTAWASIAPYPFPVEGNATATDPQTGDVYSIGGSNGDGETAASYVYDPAEGQWSQIASVPQTLWDARAAFVSGTLYVVGGQAGSASSPATVVYAYNPGSDSWSQVASLPQAVTSPGLAVLDGQLYVVGGCTDVSDSSSGTCGGGTVRQAYRYDPSANTWHAVARYPVPVGDEACAGVDGQVVCTGGESSTGYSGDSIRQTWLYDPASNHWSQGTDLPYPDEEMAYAGANGKLQVAGGITGYVNNNYTYTARVSQYDPASNTWASLPSLSAPIIDADGACGMYLIGGANPGASGPGIGGLQQTAEQLPGYDQCDGSGDTSWVKPSQASLTLAPGASATVTVRLDSAKVTQPGTYQAMIYAAVNAPYPVQVATLIMVVQPPSGWILMSGKVTSNSGTPISGATVQIDTSASSVKSGPVNFTVITGINGRYQWWLDPGADDPLQVIAAKDGYVQQVVSLTKPKASLKFTLSPFPSVPY